MKKKLAMLLATTLTLTTIMAGCGSKEEAETTETTEATEETTEEETTFVEKKEGDELIVGFDQDFPPMGFVGDDGEYTGFDLAVAEELCNRLGLTFVPKPIAWDAKDAELSSGSIDCIWNGFTINGREDQYTWSDAYLNNKQVFVVREDAGIESEADLAGKVVQVQMDSSAQAALNDNQELASTFSALEEIPDYNTGFMNLEAGATDAIAMDIVVASYQIEKRSAAFKILDYEIAAEEYGVGFLLGNEVLRDQVQSELEAMAADGTLAEISTEWFGSDITTIGK